MSFWCYRFDQKNNNKHIVWISALKVCIASLGLPVNSLINDNSLLRPPGSYKKFQGRNPYNITIAILVKTMTLKRHFEINRPLGLIDLVDESACLHSYSYTALPYIKKTLIVYIFICMFKCFIFSTIRYYKLNINGFIEVFNLACDFTQCDSTLLFIK